MRNIELASANHLFDSDFVDGVSEEHRSALCNIPIGTFPVNTEPENLNISLRCGEWKGYREPLIRSTIQTLIERAVSEMASRGEIALEGLPPVEITDTRDPSHGDYACNFALMASKGSGVPPRTLAEKLREAVSRVGADVFAEIEVAGPGFLNLRLHPHFLTGFVSTVLERGEELAKSHTESGKRINVEFVSVNPNGPITVGSGRGAAFGDTLCNVLAAAGNTVHREFYINDGVNSEQMRLFAESVLAYLRQTDLPEGGYKGEYVQRAAEELRGRIEEVDWVVAHIQTASQTVMIEHQRADLEAFGVVFDTWFSEQSLHDSGGVAKCLEDLARKHVADDEPYQSVVERKKGEGPKIGRVDQPKDEDDASGTGKTLWLRSTKFGDDKDRVLRRKDGRLTYISSDIAYHKDKFNRPPNADKLITVLGPDHHGYITRLHAVLAALIRGAEDTPEANKQALMEAQEKLEVVIFQIVRFLKEGKPAPMRKRDGNIYELKDLINELGKAAAPNETVAEQLRIGRDVARFFYLMRSHDTHMDFDIDLATKQSDENPVFYAQYAHARICSILRKAVEEGYSSDNPSVLSDPREFTLLKKIADLPHEVARAAADYGVHRLTTYVVELARTYHHFYDGCRVLQAENPGQTAARLQLCRAAALGLKCGLAVLGISAPEKMERAASA